VLTRIRKISSLGCSGIPLFCACIIGILSGCARHIKYVPDPVKDVDLWVRNFEQQRSFSYEYEMKSSFARVHASGDCVVGVGERLVGQWEGGGAVQRFEYIGLGDVEYARKDHEWNSEPRGEESDVFTQVRRLLSFDKFEYKGSEGGYLYAFKANVPFLAPDRRKEMIGFMRMSKKDYLPEFVWAGLPDSSIYWTARIFDYNIYKYVNTPVREYHDYVVSFPVGASRGIDRMIENRLDLLKVEYRIHPSRTGLLISFPEQYAVEEVIQMLRPGGLCVYVVAEAGQTVRRTAYIKDDLYEPVFLSDLLFTDDLVKDATIGFDQRSTPFILLKLRERLKMPSTIAFEIDSVLIATVTLDTVQTMDRIRLYPDMQYREIEMLRAYIRQPMVAVEVSSRGGENP
jgi:hypothetical protein